MLSANKGYNGFGEASDGAKAKVLVDGRMCDGVPSQQKSLDSQAHNNTFSIEHFWSQYKKNVDVDVEIPVPRLPFPATPATSRLGAPESVEEPAKILRGCPLVIL